MLVPLAQVEALFGTTLGHYQSTEREAYRGRTGYIQLPREDFTEEQANNIVGVFGLDN